MLTTNWIGGRVVPRKIWATALQTRHVIDHPHTIMDSEWYHAEGKAYVYVYILYENPTEAWDKVFDTVHIAVIDENDGSIQNLESFRKGYNWSEACRIGGGMKNLVSRELMKVYVGEDYTDLLDL